jgi:hypothetical protein
LLHHRSKPLHETSHGILSHGILSHGILSNRILSDGILRHWILLRSLLRGNLLNLNWNLLNLSWHLLVLAALTLSRLVLEDSFWLGWLGVMRHIGLGVFSDKAFELRSEALRVYSDGSWSISEV